jgi:hypothetical protein
MMVSPTAANPPSSAGDAYDGLRTPLPWNNINQVIVDFDQPGVTVAEGDMEVCGINGPFTVSGFSSVEVNPDGVADNGDEFTRASWTLSEVIGADNLQLTLSDNVQSSAGVALDGDFDNAVGDAPSGDDVAGGNFVFPFTVLPGDVDRDFGTDLADAFQVFLAQTAFLDVLNDVNADGSVNLTDVFTALLAPVSTLPTDAPNCGSIASAAVAAATASDLMGGEMVSVDDPAPASYAPPAPSAGSDGVVIDPESVDDVLVSADLSGLTEEDDKDLMELAGLL